MSRLTSVPALLLAPLAALALAGCEAPATAPTRATATVPAADVVVNDKTPTTITFFNDCNGDVLTGSQVEHYVFGTTADGAGGYNVMEKLQLSHVQLTGTPSGASYVGSLEYSANYHLAAGSTFTTFVTLKLIGQGQTPNTVLHEVQHVTVNANGTVTASFDHFSLDCH